MNMRSITMKNIYGPINLPLQGDIGFWSLRSQGATLV